MLIMKAQFVKGEGNLLVDNVLFLSSYSVTSEGPFLMADHGEETIGHNLNGSGQY